MGIPEKAVENLRYEGRRVANSNNGFFKFLLAAVLVVIAVAVGFSVFAVYGYDGIYPGVYAAGEDASYMPKDELLSLLEKKDTKDYRGKSLKLNINGKSFDISADDIEAGYSPQETADKAYGYGRSGNFFGRFSDISKAFFTHADVLETVSFNSEKLNAVIARAADQTRSEYEEQAYTVSDDTLIINLGKSKVEVDEDEIKKLVTEKIQKADFSDAVYEPVIENNKEVDLEKIKAEIEREPEDAKLDLKSDPSGKTITPHIAGLKLDTEKAHEILKQNKGETVEIPLTVIEPTITTDKLRGMLFKDILCEVTTNLNPGLVARTSNVRLAASFVNGTILNAGEEFSYNKAVGPRTPERGFKDAKIFQSGEIVDGIGGGICQVSSTLYMAALRSDFKITERRNHNFAVAYTPLGQDATVVYGSTDFRFVNTSEYPVRISVKQSGSTVKVIFYGTKISNKTVKLETTVLEKTPFQQKTVNTTELPAGSKKVKTEGHTGYKTVTYRLVYENGELISRELENKSTYAKLDHVVLVGTPSGTAGSTLNPNVGDDIIPDETVPPEDNTEGDENSPTVPDNNAGNGGGEPEQNNDDSHIVL